MRVGVRKSLTWSGHKLQGRTEVQGLKISIENRAGSYRRGVDRDGHPWKSKLYHDYGYIRGSVGVDGDHVDCFLGPDRESTRVYVIRQVVPGTKRYDEDKVLLGFRGAEEAKRAYLANYDRSDMFGSISRISIDELKQRLQERKGKPLTKARDDDVILIPVAARVPATVGTIRVPQPLRSESGEETAPKGKYRKKLERLLLRRYPNDDMN